jgi:3-oxoacyl-[acyl-carrier protein] reductase
MSELAGKVALVTGGSRGIGAAIAKRLAADGAAVAITYAASSAKADELVNAIKQAGGKALALRADSGDAAAVKGAVAETVKQFGGIDILVNNAGVALMGAIGEFPEADFERTIAVNIRGVFYATQEAVKQMKDGGRIINIGSVNSDSMPFAGGSVYALSKGAVASFTRGLARDLGGRGITANNIQPGPVDTDMNPAEGEFAETLTGLMAIKRYGRGEEIAALDSHLAGPDGAYITGANIKIDGGFDA